MLRKPDKQQEVHMIKTILKHLIVSCTLLMLSGCGRTSDEAPVMTIYHDGNEYNIIENGDTYDNGQPARLIRYYSENPGNEAVLKAERKDLCAIVAKHIDTNKHQRIVIIATEDKGRLFGLLRPREVSESLSAAEVLTYLPKGAKNVPEEN